MGHASRCVPIIEHFIEKKWDVVLIGNGSSLKFLKEKYTGLKAYELGSFDVHYHRRPEMVKLSIGAQIPYFIKTKKLENSQLKEIVTIEKPDLIISDNRYGVYHKEVKSVIISHQLNPRFPVLKLLFQKQIESWLNKFDEIWVPDVPEINLAGNLASKIDRLEEKIKYIGFLSQFERSYIQQNNNNANNSIGLLLSGPEPQRSIFQKLVLHHPEVKKLNLNVYGNNISLASQNNQREFGILHDHKLVEHLRENNTIICRCGYSSVMDMAYLNQNCLFVPTPGQPEQLYLGSYLQKNFSANSIKQKQLKEKRPDILKLARPLNIQKKYFGLYKVVV